MNAFNTLRGLRLPRWFDAIVIAATTAAIYAQVAGHNFIVFDDPLYVTGNQRVLNGLSWSSFCWSWTNFDAANYHPLTWLSYQLDIELFGPRPGCMAVENAGLHAFNGWLVARLLSALGCSRWGALFGALAFVAHPLNVESVAWISQRKTMLAAAFGLIAILVYLRRTQNEKQPVNWVVALALVASLLSKAWFVVLPVLFLIFDFWPLRRLRVEGNVSPSITCHRHWIQFFRQAWPLLKEKIPLFVLIGAATVAAVLSQRAQGAVASVELVPLGLRLQNALVSTANYLSDTFRLGGFSLYYPLPKALPLSRVLLAAGLLAGATVLAIASARRCATLLAGWLWFLLYLLPIIGLVQVGGQARADRYMYLPLVGMLWILVFLAEKAWTTLSPSLRPLLVGAAVLWTLALGAVAWRQTSLWRNTFGIVGHSIAVTGGGPRLVGMLGTAHLQVGRWEAAIPLLERSLRDDPWSGTVAINLALGYVKVGRKQDAVDLIKQVLEREPDNYAANYNLALYYRENGDEEMAQKFEARLGILRPAPGVFNAPDSPRRPP